MLNYKRLFVQASIALLVGLAILVILPDATALSPWRVCQEGCANDSIQEAIVNATPGDTIIIESGVYKDPLIIGRPVKLVGLDTGSGRPSLDPEKGRVILAAQGAELSGFDLTGMLPGGIEDDGCSLEVILPAVIYHNDFSGRSSVCPEDAAAWNSSDRISYKFNSRVLRSFLGNYWADYVGADGNGDGIGDEPVILNEDNIDYYPLMLPAEYYQIPDGTGRKDEPGTEVIQAQVGEKFDIPLSSNPTTGYNWSVDYDHLLLSLESSDYKASTSKALGAGGVSIFIFEPLKPGKTTIYFVYKRPWENIVADARAFQVDISA